MAGDIVAKDRLAQAAIGAVVIRADGRREDLGTVAYYHRNRLKRLRFRLLRALGRRVEVF